MKNNMIQLSPVCCAVCFCFFVVQTCDFCLDKLDTNDAALFDIGQT